MDSFATAQDLYGHIGEILPDDLSRAQGFLREASSLIRTAAGQVLSTVANDSITLVGRATNVLYLPELPVTAVTSVTEAGVLQDAATYTFDSSGTLTRVSGAAWLKGATVVYSHGYQESSTEYGEIRTLTIEVAARALQGPGGQAENFGMVMPTTVGFSPSVFLTDNERQRITNLGPVPIG